jgi:photosystem II stability/assembly factor-like uncharacterized protein
MFVKKFGEKKMEIPSKTRSIRLGFMGAALVVLPTLAISAYALSPMQVDAVSESDICITATLLDDPTVVAQQGWCEDAAVLPDEDTSSETLEPTTPPVNNFANLTFESQTGSFNSFSVSEDGKTMLAADKSGQALVSTDSGKKWIYKLSSTIEVGMSSDGTKMIATTSHSSGPWSVWVSNNSGASWGKVLTGSKSNYGVSNFRGPTISKDGTTMIVYDDHYKRFHVSTDSGTTWKILGVNSIRHSATSSDGKTIIVGDRTSDIWIQVDGGALTKIPPIAEVSSTFSSIAMSADGKTILAGGSTGKLYLSKDTGSTWSEHTELAGKSLRKVAISNDGSKMAVAAAGIYVSTDSGTTWSLSKAPLKTFLDLDISPDGSKIYAAEYNPGAPWWIGTFGP